MAEAADKDSKTEEPTEKKIRDSVEKGQLPFSKEAPIFASFTAMLIFAVFFVQDSMTRLAGFLATFLENPAAWPLDTAQDAVSLFTRVFLETGRALGVILLLLVCLGVAGSMLQNVPRMVLERIRPKASRLSISQGWKRLFGQQGMVEFAKSLGKILVVGTILVFIMRNTQAELLLGMVTSPTAFGLVIRDLVVDMLSVIMIFTLVVAVADIVWSRFHWRRDLRMTKQEVKDEFKQSDGDPIVKARLRSIARSRARQRMLTAVPKATLIIANPTHFSIALRYVREESAAPVVVAKGQDLVALRIREIAAEHNIPVFEDVALARSMYKQVSVDSMIPPQFYQAVAELVRIVYSKPGSPQHRVNP
jgi:flagellar biosynthetic protein FlhB